MYGKCTARRRNVLSFDEMSQLIENLWLVTVGINFFRFVTIHAIDRQTDGRTDRIALAIEVLQSHGKN